MSHMPYERWLFSDEPLSSEEQKALQEHLLHCEQCNLVFSAWGEVKRLLNSETAVEPTEGFVERWQIRFIEHQQREHERKANRHSWVLFIINLSMAALLFTFLLTQLLNIFGSPINLLLVGISHYATYFAFLAIVDEFFITVIKVTLSVISPTLWIVIGLILLLMNLFWLLSLRVLLSPWRLKT